MKKDNCMTMEEALAAERKAHENTLWDALEVVRRIRDAIDLFGEREVAALGMGQTIRADTWAEVVRDLSAIVDHTPEVRERGLTSLREDRDQAVERAERAEEEKERIAKKTRVKVVEEAVECVARRMNSPRISVTQMCDKDRILCAVIGDLQCLSPSFQTFDAESMREREAVNIPERTHTVMELITALGLTPELPAASAPPAHSLCDVRRNPFCSTCFPRKAVPFYREVNTRARLEVEGAIWDRSDDASWLWPAREPVDDVGPCRPNPMVYVREVAGGAWRWWAYAVRPVKDGSAPTQREAEEAGIRAIKESL